MKLRQAFAKGWEMESIEAVTGSRSAPDPKGITFSKWWAEGMVSLSCGERRDVRFGPGILQVAQV